MLGTIRVGGSTVVVEALWYKPEGCSFDSRWGHWDFHWLNTFGCTLARESTQPLTEMRLPVNRAWQPYHLIVEPLGLVYTVMGEGETSLEIQRWPAVQVIHQQSNLCSQPSAHSSAYVMKASLIIKLHILWLQVIKNKYDNGKINGAF